MVWFKVDDSLPASRKVLSIPRGSRAAAMGLWVLAGSWSAGEELDGFVPAFMVSELDGSIESAEWLVRSGLWEEADGGYRFSSWADYQPVRSELDAKREAERQRKAAWRERRATKTDGDVPSMSQQDADGTDAETSACVRESSALSRTRPVPDPTPISPNGEIERPRKRGSRVPPDFVITDELREWAAIEVPDVDIDARLSEWIDYWTAQPGQKGVKVDWVATWRNGMRKQQEWRQRDVARHGSERSGTHFDLIARMREEEARAGQRGHDDRAARAIR